MARKSQANPSRNKPTARAKSATTAASGTKRQSTTGGKLNEEKSVSETPSSPQSPALSVARDINVELKNVELNVQPPSPHLEFFDGTPAPAQILVQNPVHGSVQEIGELQQQFAELKKQLETVQGNYATLQQTSTEQAKAIETLHGQLEQRNLEQITQQDRYVALQQKAIEQTQTIEQLQGQIKMLEQHMEQRLSDQLNQLQSDAATHQNSSEVVAIDVLNSVQQQVAGLQTEVTQQVMQQMTQQQRYEVLKRLYEEQAQVIAELRSLVAQEQRHAAIGEAHLNKWRYRTFSS